LFYKSLLSCIKINTKLDHEQQFPLELLGRKIKNYHRDHREKKPLPLAKQLQLHPGSPVTLEIVNGRIIIQTQKYNLEKMLKEITPENSHNQILDDGQKGNEGW